MNQLQRDKAWQKRFLPEVKRIIMDECIGHIISVRISSDDEDWHKATDLVVDIKGGEIAVRMRRPPCDFRDLTIRSRRMNGIKTELAKIREGASRWYLYCWTNGEKIPEWIFVDMNAMRSSGLIYQDRPEKLNKDGQTFFIRYEIHELEQYGCLLKKRISSNFL